MKTRLSTLRLISTTLLISGAITLLLAAAGAIKPEVEGPEDEDSDAGQADEAFKFRRLQLQDENGKIPADGLVKAKAQMEAMRVAQVRRAELSGKPKGMKCGCAHTR